ncbi:MAG: caspase family protein [Oligoflexus sp.]
MLASLSHFQKILICFLIWSLSVFFNSALSQVMEREPKRFYLVIGIDEYRDNFWRALNFAGKDAEDLHKFFAENFDGGWVLTGKTTKTGFVDKADIQKSFERLSQENLHELDSLVVYFSAHGTIGHSINNNDGSRQLEKYLVTSDTRSDNPSENGLSHAELMSWFSKLKSRRKVLIFDTCYAGGGKSQLNENMLHLLARQRSQFFLEPQDRMIEGSMILAASAWGQEAQEDPKLQNGVYTHFLLKGFHEDLNQDGAVSITEAHHYAANHVIQYSQGSQHPTARIEVVGTDPIVVHGQVNKNTGAPWIFAYEWVLRKLEVEVDGRSLGSLSKGGVALPEGKRHLTIRDENGNVLVSRFVDFSKGQEYALSHFLYHEPKWSFQIAGGGFWVLNEELRQRLVSRPLAGFAALLKRRDGLGGLADFELSLNYFPSQTMRIESNAMQVEQSLSLIEISMGAAKDFVLWPQKLRRRQWGFLVTPRLHAGFQQIDRKLADSSYLEPLQKAQNFIGKLGLDLATKLPSADNRLGLRLESTAAPSVLYGGPQLLIGIQGHLFWSWYW